MFVSARWSINRDGTSLLAGEPHPATEERQESWPSKALPLVHTGCRRGATRRLSDQSRPSLGTLLPPQTRIDARRRTHAIEGRPQELTQSLRRSHRVFQRLRILH